MLDNWSRKDGSLHTQLPRTGLVSQASFSIPQSSKAMHVEDVTSIAASPWAPGGNWTPGRHWFCCYELDWLWVTLRPVVFSFTVRTPFSALNIITVASLQFDIFQLLYYLEKLIDSVSQCERTSLTTDPASFDQHVLMQNLWGCPSSLSAQYFL